MSIISSAFYSTACYQVPIWIIAFLFHLVFIRIIIICCNYNCHQYNFCTLLFVGMSVKCASVFSSSKPLPSLLEEYDEQWSCDAQLVSNASDLCRYLIDENSRLRSSSCPVLVKHNTFFILSCHFNHRSQRFTHLPTSTTRFLRSFYIFATAIFNCIIV